MYEAVSGDIHALVLTVSIIPLIKPDRSYPNTRKNIFDFYHFQQIFYIKQLDVIHIDSIADQWDTTDDDDVMSYTDTDLLLARNWSTRFYDSENTLQPLIRTVMAEYPVESESEAMDMALRVAIAKAIDDKITVIDRQQFDVKYSIPPRGWVDRQRFDVDDIVTVPPDEQSKYLATSAPPVCEEMCHALRDEGVFDSLTDIERYGLEILTGQQ
jgi:hypothetical protein